MTTLELSKSDEPKNPKVSTLAGNALHAHFYGPNNLGTVSWSIKLVMIPCDYCYATQLVGFVIAKFKLRKNDNNNSRLRYDEQLRVISRNTIQMFSPFHLEDPDLFSNVGKNYTI